MYQTSFTVHIITRTLMTKHANHNETSNKSFSLNSLDEIEIKSFTYIDYKYIYKKSLRQYSSIKRYDNEYINEIILKNRLLDI